MELPIHLLTASFSWSSKILLLDQCHAETFQWEPEKKKRTRQVTMKSLALLLVVALAVAVTLAYDSIESHESYERYDPFVNSRNANSFMPSQQRNTRMHERIRERTKSTRERQRETCEDYNPCDRYAMRHGWAAAYKRYFGKRYGEK
ncbi:matrix Gla protein [Hyla sarda]|uniref:matrix Gla protein n=1 Tax=Hyla sarda TaxID=327740 RepID=UPI0024C34D07|nr:matrix Gla protein [Hyla sarda]